jgi:biopolymer transport protein ExbD
MAVGLSLKIPRKIRRTSTTEVWPLSIAVLMVVCFYLMTGHIKQPEPLVELPTSSGVCVPSLITYDITIDKDNRIYFSIEDKKIQAAVIQHVASQHTVRLNKQQFQELNKLPYIGMDVRLLPAALAMPRIKRYSLQQGLPCTTSNNQLSELIGVARILYPTLTGRTISCAIRIDKRVPFAQVRTLIKILEHHNVTRFSIKTTMD